MRLTRDDTAVSARGARRRDSPVDDALQTMERLALWLDSARQENVWLQTNDPIQMAMLYGMLTHLDTAIADLLLLGGDEVAETVHALQALATEELR